MRTEYRVYELKRDESRLYGYFILDFQPAKDHGEYQMIVPNLNGPGWDGLRLWTHRHPDYEELLVMATGWLPLQVRLETMSGMWLSRDYLPMSYYTAHATDMETGFARFSTAGMEGPIVTYLVTARRSA